MDKFTVGPCCVQSLGFANAADPRHRSIVRVSGFTFRYGMQAARMALTVRSERAKPTKYVCSGRRPSLNNHLAENRETSEFSIYKSRLSKVSSHTKSYGWNYWGHEFTYQRVG